MSNVHFKLDDTLRRYKKTPFALVEASGLAKATVYKIVNNEAKAVKLETISKLMNGLRELTGEAVTLDDVLEEINKPDWREEILKNAKPLDWDKMMAGIPDWTEEEREENSRVFEEIERERREDAKRPSKRIEQMLEIFSSGEASTETSTVTKP